jgi:hypothetical protein
MNNSTLKGMETVALAMILAPEPFTTIPGIALLVAAKAAKAASGPSRPAPQKINRFEDYYKYKVHDAGKGVVSYRIAPVRDGQIPHAPPHTVRLYDTNAWQGYRKSTYAYLREKDPNEPNFRGIQKGLLEDVNKGLNHRKY